MKDKLIELLDSREFYEIMQSYRNIPISEQDKVIKSFNEVKQFIYSEISALKAEQEKEPLSADDILEKHCMGEYFMNKRYRQLKHIRPKIIEAMKEYRQQGIDWDKIENEFYTWGFQDPSRRHILGWFKSKITQ